MGMESLIVLISVRPTYLKLNQERADAVLLKAMLIAI
jgi:hypothetical protein